MDVSFEADPYGENDVWDSDDTEDLRLFPKKKLDLRSTVRPPNDRRTSCVSASHLLH
jgi:hypothetical protein